MYDYISINLLSPQRLSIINETVGGWTTKPSSGSRIGGSPGTQDNENCCIKPAKNKNISILAIISLKHNLRPVKNEGRKEEPNL